MDHWTSFGVGISVAVGFICYYAVQIIDELKAVRRSLDGATTGSPELEEISRKLSLLLALAEREASILEEQRTRAFARELLQELDELQAQYASGDTPDAHSESSS